MNFRLILTVLILTTHYSFSQIRSHKQAQELYAQTLNHIQKGLAYLERTQQKKNDSIFKFKGEWQTQMSMDFWFPLLGGENNSYDSNCFSVSTIHNTLAEIYLQYPEYQEIPAMLELAFGRIMAYESNGTFNFWNLLPPNKPHKWLEKETNELVRRPNNFPLRVKFMRKAANVTDDADDTAAGLLAIYLYNQITDRPNPDSLDSIHKIFDPFVDINRRNRHWYNFWQKQGPDSGAYLTWLGKETSFASNWNPVKELLHLSTFYLPLSKMFPHAYQPYIPYGTNDIDLVVNANVLRILSIYDNHKSKASQNAVEFIEDHIEDKNYNYAATYYPNRYHIPYYVSKAYKKGVFRLKRSCEIIETDILRKFSNDKSWSSRDLINKGDQLQSTILAVNSLLNISGIQSKGSEEAILAGLDYIFSNANKNNNEIYWTGGVFFSGGTLVRHVLHWKSDAVTTAMVLEALINFRSQLEAKYPNLNTSNLKKQQG